jgi:hypothetical protein
MSSSENDSDRRPPIEAEPTAEKDQDVEKPADVPDWPEMMVRTEAEEWVPERAIVEEKPENEE